MVEKHWHSVYKTMGNMSKIITQHIQCVVHCNTSTVNRYWVTAMPSGCRIGKHPAKHEYDLPSRERLNKRSFIRSQKVHSTAPIVTAQHMSNSDCGIYRDLKSQKNSLSSQAVCRGSSVTLAWCFWLMGLLVLLHKAQDPSLKSSWKSNWKPTGPTLNWSLLVWTGVKWFWKNYTGCPS